METTGPELTRRGLLKAGAGTVAGMAILAGCGSGSGPTTLRVAWYGGPKTQPKMRKVFKIYKNDGHADATINTQYADFGDYWDKLATQAAAGNAPDLFRMSARYLTQYIERGTLLDLSPYENKVLNLSPLNKGTLAPAKRGDKQYAVGMNAIAQAMFYKPGLFEQAGVDTPDDTWTWSDFADVSKELAKAGGDETYGTADPSFSALALEAFLIGKGKDLYKKDGDKWSLGFPKDELAEWFSYWQDLRNAKVAVPAEVTAGFANQGAQQHPLVHGQAAIGFGWMQQLTTYQNLTKDTLAIHTPPGGSRGPGYGLGALDFWAGSGETEYPEAVATLINVLVNNARAIGTLGLTLGGPPSQRAHDILEENANPAGKKVLDYLELVQKRAEAIPARAPAHGDVVETLNRVALDVAFGKKSVQKGVDDFFDQAGKALD